MDLSETNPGEQQDTRPSPDPGYAAGHAGAMADVEDSSLRVYLQEYETVWGEVFSRFENQRQSFNYVVVIIGAVAAAYAGVLGSSSHVSLPGHFYLVAPLIIMSLGFIFFDNELMIWSIVYYTRYHLRERVQTLTNDKSALELECRRFYYLPRGTQRLHRLLSYGRWAVFLLPSAVMASYAVWECPACVRRPGFGFLLLLNTVAFSLLLYAMLIAARRQAIWTSAGEASVPTQSKAKP